MAKERILPNVFYVVNITLMAKLKDIKRKENNYTQHLDGSVS